MFHCLCIAVSVDKPEVAGDIVPIHTREHPIPDALLQPAMRRVQHASEELQTIVAWENHIIAAMQIEEKLTVKECFHEFPIFSRCAPTVCENCKVIAVTQVMLDAKRVLHIPIKFVQVDV